MLREQTTQDEEHFLAWCCNRALFDFRSLDADAAARFFLFLFLLNCAVREIRRPKQKTEKNHTKKIHREENVQLTKLKIA